MRFESRRFGFLSRVAGGPPVARLAVSAVINASVALMAMALLAGGCQATASRPLSSGDSGEPTLASRVVRDADGAEYKTEFWYQLGRQPVATNDDAFHALLMYLDGNDPSSNYAERVRLMKARLMLPASFDEPAAAPLQRGVLAAALVNPLKIRGGLTMQIMGPSPRYATRALEYRGLFPVGTPNQAFSGAEFVGVMGRVEDFQRVTNPADKPAAMLPGETVEPDPATLAPGLGAGDAEDNGNAVPARAADMPRDITRPVLLSLASSAVWWRHAAAAQDEQDDQNEQVEQEEADGANGLAEPGGRATRRSATTRRATTRPATGPADAPTRSRPLTLRVIITGVEGDQTQVRENEGAPWVAAKVGMDLSESSELRTGAKSAIRFFIAPDHVYTIDRQTSVKVLAAYYDGRKVKTDVGMEHGRVRLDVERIAGRDANEGADGANDDTDADPAGVAEPAYQIEEGGLEHDSTIRSPNTALAVRGTRVSLYDQAPFTPEAISLTGRAEFRNTRRQLVAFGGNAKARVRGAQASAAEQALASSFIPASAQTAQNDFEAQETAELISRGGLVRGDVLAGNSFGVPSVFPGDLNFVLNWTGGPERQFNDLNLAVFGPDSVNGAFDFVANPPFTLSLDPTSVASQDLRRNSGLIPPQDPARPRAFYPRESRTGGRIGRNHVGPEGREVAFWPGNYPTGAYQVQVFNLVDVPIEQRPTPTGDPVPFTVQAFQRSGGTVQPVGSPITGAVRELETSQPFTVRITEPPSGRALRRRGR